MYAPGLLPTTPAALGRFPVIGPVSLAGIFDGRHLETVEAGEAVFWQADQATNVFQVVEGCLRLYRVLTDGRRAITGFAFAGGVLGISLHDRHDYTAEAVTAVKLRRMGRGAFHAAVDGSAELRPQLLALIFDEMSTAQDQMVTLGCKNADERVASFLVTTARRTGADLDFPVEVELPMSRLDIAHFLGLTIETVSRTFSKLKRDGLI
jgi:CRP/FNR family transcriptional regulator, anaerobic regulatory protein